MKKVAIVTFWSFVAQGHAKQLREVLGDEVSILCYSFDSYEFKEVIDADLVVFSLFSIYLGIKKYISSRAKVVIVTLTLNNAQYQKVLDIPRGEKVMVVNYSSDMAMETIALFNQLVLDHLEYVPVYPGLTTIPKIKIAVTPGESHLIPEGVETIIDIHQRVLDTQTLADVLVKLGMENLLYSRAFIAHADSLLSYRAGVELLLGKTDTLQSEFISLLNVLEQGILAVNDQLFVHALNRKAQEILGSTTEEAVGRRYTELVPEFQFERVITSAEPIRKVLLSVQGEELSVTIVPVVNARKVSGAIALFSRFTDEERVQHQFRTQLLGKGHKAKYHFQDIVGENPNVVQLKTVAARMAKSESSVLITGESGTGKELFAQAIHNASRRKEYQFVAINCAALPESILESELFGYEEGAFTGARKGGKRGLFELAHDGTLFLDEICEMALPLQSRLLRVIQEREVIRLGSDRVIGINMRLIAASNRDLGQMVNEGLFRKDLFYRLNVLPLRMIPLRNRIDDLAVLIKSIQRDLQVGFTFSNEAMVVLKKHLWPGNIRELKNMVEYWAHLDKAIIDIGDLENLANQPCRVFAPSKKGEGLLADLAERAGFGEREIYFVLNCLEAVYRERRRIGRRGIARLADGQGLFLSEGDVRKILKELASDDLVSLSQGRGGARITARGMMIVGSQPFDTE